MSICTNDIPAESALVPKKKRYMKEWKLSLNEKNIPESHHKHIEHLMQHVHFPSLQDIGGYCIVAAKQDDHREEHYQSSKRSERSAELILFTQQRREATTTADRRALSKRVSKLTRRELRI